MTLILVDGSQPRDPRLGRVRQFDDRSRNFSIHAILDQRIRGTLPRRAKTWKCRARLNQLQTPRCTGYASAHWYSAAPFEHVAQPELADIWYFLGQDNDQWPGREPDYFGGSTLGVMKAGMVMNPRRIARYDWMFSLDDYIDTLCWLGPVITGTNWHRQMFDPTPEGFVKVAGPIDGGHEWLLRGVNPTKGFFIARNSWGWDWGIGGDFKISFEDFTILMNEDGDGAHPTEYRPNSASSLIR